MKLTYKNSFYKNIEKFLNSMSLLSLIFMFTAFSILIINDLKFENNVTKNISAYNATLEDNLNYNYFSSDNNGTNNIIKESKSIKPISLKSDFVHAKNDISTCTYQINHLEDNTGITETPKYTEKELDMLSRIIFAEAGSDCISDEHQQLVGMVVINRINDPRFPDTMEGVIMAKGQYACVDNGSYYMQPSERAIENAKKVLNGEVTAPKEMVYQAEFVQGYEVYKIFNTPWSTTYFCLG